MIRSMSCQDYQASIARVQLKELERRVRAMEMDITFSDAAVAELAKAGFDPVYGARPLKRAIQQQVEKGHPRREVRAEGHDLRGCGGQGVSALRRRREG